MWVGGDARDASTKCRTSIAPGSRGASGRAPRHAFRSKRGLPSQANRVSNTTSSIAREGSTQRKGESAPVLAVVWKRLAFVRGVFPRKRATRSPPLIAGDRRRSIAGTTPCALQRSAHPIPDPSSGPSTPAQHTCITTRHRDPRHNHNKRKKRCRALPPATRVREATRAPPNTLIGSFRLLESLLEAGSGQRTASWGTCRVFVFGSINQSI